MSAPTTFEVTLPAGGKLELDGIDEVELWEQSSRRYVRDYQLTQQNDLLLLGAILSQQLLLFRAQKRMNGMEPERDANGRPTGRYTMQEPKAADMAAAQGTIKKAAEEIRALEKALGIDKATREAGGAHTVTQYVTDLKAAAREYGVHLSKRTLAYEEFANGLRWRLRILHNGDAEDRAYHKLTEKSVLSWANFALAELEAIDKAFAREKGRLFVGKVR